jgi:hypothetical protein
MGVLDVVDIQHHVVAHLQREVELLELLPRRRIRRLRRIQRAHLVAQRRAVDLHEDQAKPVRHVFHQRGLAVAGRRDQHQQAHQVAALVSPTVPICLARLSPITRQVDIVDQLVAHEAGQRARLELRQAHRLALSLDDARAHFLVAAECREEGRLVFAEARLQVVDRQAQRAVVDARMLPEQAGCFGHQADVDDAVRKLRAMQVQRRRFMRVGGEGGVLGACRECLQPLQQQRPLRAGTILQAFQRLVEQRFAAACRELRMQRIEQAGGVAGERQLIGIGCDRGDQERGRLGLQSLGQRQCLLHAELCDGLGELGGQCTGRGRVLQVAAHGLRIADAFQPACFGRGLRLAPERDRQCACIGGVHQRTRRAIQAAPPRAGSARRRGRGCLSRSHRDNAPTANSRTRVASASGSPTSRSRVSMSRPSRRCQRRLQQLSGQVFAAIQRSAIPIPG